MNSSRDIRNLQYLLSRCENDIPHSILDTQYNVSEALTRFYGSQRQWTMKELESSLKYSDEFRRSMPRDYDIVVKLVYDDELQLIGIDPKVLTLKERSQSSPGWYLPFLSPRAFEHFEHDMKKLKDVLRVVRQ